MGSHLWALSSPTFISLPATSLGRANLWCFTFTPGSPHLPWCQPSHAAGTGSSEELLLLYGNQAGMATERFSSPQKFGILGSAHSRELESTRECEDSNMGSPGIVPVLLASSTSLSKICHPRSIPCCPELPQVQPTPHRRSHGDHQVFPETPTPAWHLSHPLPSFEEYKTPPRAGVGLAGGGQAGVGTAGLLLHPGARARHRGCCSILLHPGFPRCALEKIKKKQKNGTSLHLIKKVNTRAV